MNSEDLLMGIEIICEKDEDKQLEGTFLLVSKLEVRLPLWHLKKQLHERHGSDCSRQAMAR